MDVDDEDIYITLPSSASMELYPGNTLASYKTIFQHPLEHERKSKLGLCEVLIHASTLNIRKEDARFIFQRRMYKKQTKYPTLEYVDEEKNTAYVEDMRFAEIKIKEGLYKNIDHLVKALNFSLSINAIASSFYFAVKPLPEPNPDQMCRVVLSASDKKNIRLDDVTITFSRQMAAMLGFIESVRIGGAEFGMVRTPINLMSFIPRMAYIYCDIITLQYVGDTMSKLLRIVQLDPNPETGEIKFTQIFDQVHYMNVASKYNTSVRVDIRDIDGGAYPFGIGTLSVKLHWKTSS
jgi:hypothetical protein